MKGGKLSVEKFITIDNTGYPRPPDVRQIQDKDILELWARDKTPDKRKYMAEAGVIYYMGDPKSPPKERGLSDRECLKEAIQNYNLSSDYVPDLLVNRLIKKYYISNITEAGVVLESLQRSIHLASIATTRINEFLNNKLSGAVSDEDIDAILDKVDKVNKRIVEIPGLTQALGKAYDNLKNEEEQQMGRGKQSVLSSMNADEDD